MDQRPAHLNRDISGGTVSILSVSSNPSHRSSVFSDSSDQTKKQPDITDGPKLSFRKTVSQNKDLQSLPEYPRPNSAPLPIRGSNMVDDSKSHDDSGHQCK